MVSVGEGGRDALVATRFFRHGAASFMFGLCALERGRSPNAQVYRVDLVNRSGERHKQAGLRAGPQAFNAGDWIGFYTGKWAARSATYRGTGESHDKASATVYLKIDVVIHSEVSGPTSEKTAARTALNGLDPSCNHLCVFWLQAWLRIATPDWAAIRPMTLTLHLSELLLA